MEADPLLAARLAVDTAALVLIWLVQLVIYPAFLHFSSDDFGRWHPIYTRRVTYVVLPVMLSQVVIYGLALLGGAPMLIWLQCALIATVWLITFLHAVPLHATLDGPGDHLPQARRLLRVNWVRTLMWTVVWGMTLAELLSGYAGVD